MLMIDTNQAMMDSELLRLLESKTIVIQNALDTGDLYFVGSVNGEQINVGIELKKSPSDLVSSLGDQRLLTQLPRMVNEYDVPYLILTGEPDLINFSTNKIQTRKGKWQDSSFHYNYLNAILSRFELSGGHIRHARDTEHLVYLIISLMQFWRKDAHSEKIFVRPNQRFMGWDTIDDPMLQVYERMGIGLKRAEVLRKNYPNLLSLMQADPKELLELDGFGKKTINKLKKIIEG